MFLSLKTLSPICGNCAAGVDYATLAPFSVYSIAYNRSQLVAARPRQLDAGTDCASIESLDIRVCTKLMQSCYGGYR